MEISTACVASRRLCALLTVCHLLGVVLSTSSSEWTPGSSFDDLNSVDSYTTAFLNVTYRLGSRMFTDRSELGKYGEGHVGAAAGVVVHVDGDHTGCVPPLVAQPPTEPWVALVRRGHCNFEVKVELAFRSNAVAIVVYNDHESSTLDKMRLSTDTSRNISAVFTYKWKGEELARLVDNGTRVYMQISVGNQCTKSYSNINRTTIMLMPRFTICDPSLPASHCVHLTSVLFVSISFIVLMIISLAWLVFYYVQRFRYIHAKDRLSRRLCSAAKKALSRIPTKSIKSGDKEILGDGECCAVCIEPYKVSDVLRILPCRHEFHKSCIDPWLLEHRTCPMCKMDILKYYGFIFTGSQESILHMDIEEVAGVDSLDSLQSRSLSPTPHIHPIDHQLSHTATPEQRSHSSRASTPDEMTPSLCPGRLSGQPSAGPSHHSSCELAMGPGSPTASSRNCDIQYGLPPRHDLQDCQLESCESSPVHQSNPESSSTTAFKK